MKDVIVIGAGIVGSFIAHELSKRECSVMVIDKASDIAEGASLANSAIVHSGHDPKPGTLKARFNVRGNRMYPDICKELGVSFVNCSAMVVATSPEESSILDTLVKQSTERMIPFMDYSGDKARELEPNLSTNVQRAIEFPTTGIIYPWEVAIALMEESVLNGCELKLNEEVTGITGHDGYYTVNTSKGSYESRLIINVAGVHADDIYSLALGQQSPFKITPRRGEYYVLDQMKKMPVSRVIYPVPGPNGKGVLVVPTVNGNTLLGPNSESIDDKEANITTSDALALVKKNVNKTVENIPFDKVIRTFSGLRPTGDTGDFVIEESDRLKGFINVACIESPGIASAPAIAEYVCNELVYTNNNWPEKVKYTKRVPIRKLKNLSNEQRNELVQNKPEYGELVCRCEQISKGEILDSIHRACGAKTVKGVKKRIGPGMGRCQGGFCEPLVVDILAKELGVSPLDIRLDSDESVILVGRTKEQESL